MITSEKIALVIALWILIALLITKDTDFELFFVIVFIGLLIIRALTDVFITTTLKHRMNIIIYIFIIVFAVIVGNKIITILNA
jgi:membrane protein CcdC involved in cytochrome C biogenesis